MRNKKNNLGIWLTVVWIFLATSNSDGNDTMPVKMQNKEHKVHNIVLYPDKHSWCQKTSIVQVIAHPGCNAVKTENNVCVGGCFSYIVPRTIPSAPGDFQPYCDSCQPGYLTWKKVVLECSSGEFAGKNLTKYVEVINNCSCSACKEQLPPQTAPLQEPEEEDFYFDNNNFEESFNGTESSTNVTENNTLNDIVSNFLKSFKEGNSKPTSSDSDGVTKNLLQELEATEHLLDLNAIEKLSNMQTNLMKNDQLKNATSTRTQNFFIKLKQIYEMERNKKHSGDENGTHTQTGPHHSTVFAKDSLQISGPYAKLPHTLPPLGIEKEVNAPILDVASKHLQPATGGSEISYHDNSIIASQLVEDVVVPLSNNSLI